MVSYIYFYITTTTNYKLTLTNSLDWDIMAAFANEKRIYLLGPSMVHAVENVFAGSNVDKKKLSVVSFKLADFLTTVIPVKSLGKLSINDKKNCS